MSLAPGTKLGPYEILSPLGAGGMGEVFKARDTRLGRDVAIKALPSTFAQDPDRLARFEREAKLLATLSHPNIAGIYGLEVVGEARYLVLEFVEGETLSDRLARGPLSVGDTIDIAKQIAAGVEAAHETGVIHRDLKPGNVMITPSGAVKVLDFGLARSGATERTGSDPNLTASPTMTYLGTQTGVILGTAAYMSPEQARGKHVDRRTDIWSFGCVVYECLTGVYAFNGDTVSDMVARILEREPDWKALPASTPRRLRELVQRCMRKDARERLRDIGEARVTLDELSKGIGAERGDDAVAPTAKRMPLALLAGAVVVTALVSVLATKMLTRPAPPPTLALSIALPHGERLSGGTENNVLAISPDGQSVVYTSQVDLKQRLVLRRLDEPEGRELPGTESARNPYFSPDGEWIAFFSGRSLMKVSVRGGSPIVLAEAAADRAGVWLEDDTIIYSPTFASPLYRISSSGGEPAAITVVDSTKNERTHRWPDALPGGEWVVFTVGLLNSPGGYDDASIDVVSLKDGERRTIARGSCARYAPGGRLIFAREGSLYMVPIDPRDPRGGATAIPVLDGVRGVASSGIAFFDIADNGTLALVTGTEPREGRQLGWVDRAGNVTMIPGEARTYNNLSVSPDGTRALVQIGPGGGADDIYLVDLQSGNLNQLTFNAGSGGGRWMPDGHRVVYGVGMPSGGTRIVLRDLLGSEEEQTLTERPDAIVVYSVLPDGSGVIFNPFGLVDGDVLVVSTDGKGTVSTLVGGRFAQNSGVVSNDGRWIAFSDDQSGVREVCVRPMSGSGGRVQVSVSGGNRPMWSPSGNELFYVANNSVMAAHMVVRGGVMFVSETRTLFTLSAHLNTDSSINGVDMHPSGEKFLVLRGNEDTADMGAIAVRLNWASTLDALATGSR